MLWGWMASPAFAQTNGAKAPAYTFHSTSAYSSAVGSSAYSSTVTAPFASASTPLSAAPVRPGAIRRSFGDPEDEEMWSDPEGQGYGVGEIPDPAPIGEPWVLLGMAILYLFYRKSKKIQEKFAQSKKKQ